MSGLIPRKRRSRKIPLYKGRGPRCMVTDKDHGLPCNAPVFEKGQYKCWVHRGGDK